MAAAACVSTALSAPSIPPARYNLHDVTIGWVQSGGLLGVYRKVSITGDGRGHYSSLEVGGKKREEEFTVSREFVEGVIQSMYRVYFFDFRSGYDVAPSIRVGADGTVESVNGNISDAVSTSVFIKIGDFEKTVSFVLDAPPGLKDLAGRLAAAGDEARHRESP